jgi:hypothetical protein
LGLVASGEVKEKEKERKKECKSVVSKECLRR